MPSILKNHKNVDSLGSIKKLTRKCLNFFIRKQLQKWNFLAREIDF